MQSEIKRIALEHRGQYDYRRMLVNHKRVASIMRDDNLIVAEWPTSRLGRIEMHVNRADRMNVTGTNQLWVADRQVGD